MSQPVPGIYGRLARWVLHHPRLVLAVTLLVSILAAAFAVRLDVDSDILTLMPKDEPTTQALRKLDEEEGGVNVLTIAVDSEDPSRRDAFLDELAGKLEASPYVDYVLWKLDPDVAYRLGALQMPLADLQKVRDRLRAALSLGQGIANPFIAGTVLDIGPLTDRLARAGERLSLTSSEGVARLIVRPAGSAHDLPFARKFMHAVDSEIEALDPEAREVKVLWVGGAYRHNVEDYEGIVTDIGWITAASFVLVLIIIAGAFRNPRALAVIFGPLLVSNLWMLGLAGATVGSLNTFTSFVNAVLIGLGVEFGVHLYSRYQELRAAHHDVETSVIRAWDLVGSACTSAALTSAAGFASLLVAHFAGFRQLGWLLSLGLLACLVAELVLMPIIIAWLDHAAAGAHAVSRRLRLLKRRRPATYRLAPSALMILASLTLVAALLIRKLDFEYDLSELRRSGLAYEDLSAKEKALARESYAPVVVSFPDQASMDAAHLRLQKRMAEGRIPEIGKVISIRTVLPVDQAERVAILQEIAGMVHDPSFPYLPPAVQENLKKLAANPVELLTAVDLPPELQHTLGARNGTHRLLLIPTGNMWDMREAAHLAAVVRDEFDGPGVSAAGEYLTLGRLYELLWADGPVIGVLALVLVCFFTWGDLRKLRPTVGALAVLVAGMSWWGALLVLSDIKLSIVNFVGIPIVLGIGVDVMIHLIHRLNQEGPGRIQKALATTGWASALGTSTTVVAFAALSLASSQGIRSLGLLVLLGESAVTVAGFVLVPLGFATRWRLTGHTPMAVGEDTSPGR